jgi:hypothetical protein
MTRTHSALAVSAPKCATLVALLSIFAPCPVFSFELISNAEFKAERGARGGITELRQTLTPSNVPRIEISAPDISKKIKSPINLEVRFATDPPAVVDPKTLQVLYGALRLDITERIRKAAQITSRGISAENAVLPTGSHRLIIGIADSAGRYAEKQIRIQTE